jgi:hypothetical protein
VCSLFSCKYVATQHNTSISLWKCLGQTSPQDSFILYLVIHFLSWQTLSLRFTYLTNQRFVSEPHGSQPLNQILPLYTIINRLRPNFLKIRFNLTLLLLNYSRSPLFKSMHLFSSICMSSPSFSLTSLPHQQWANYELNPCLVHPVALANNKKNETPLFATVFVVLSTLHYYMLRPT